MLIDGKSINTQEELKIESDLNIGTSERVTITGPRIRRKKTLTKEEQIAAEKEKLDQCGF